MSPSVNPKKMVKIRRGEKIKSNIPPNTIIPSIRAGKLLATDEIFVDNQGWQRLDQHPQLAPYLSDGAKNTDSPPTTSVPTKAPTEEGFKCPKCKTLQEKSKICTQAVAARQVPTHAMNM